MRGEQNNLDEGWLAQSAPITMESVVAGQGIVDQQAEKMAFFNLLNNFNVGLSLLFGFLLSCFFVLFAAVLIKELNHRIRFGEGRRFAKISQRVTWAVCSFGRKRLSSLAVFAAFVHLFFWFTQVLFTNNIKVSFNIKVILKETH